MPCFTYLYAVIPSEYLSWSSTAVGYNGGGLSSRCFWALLFLELIPIVLGAPQCELRFLPVCKEPFSAVLDTVFGGPDFSLPCGSRQLHHVTFMGMLTV